MDRTILRTSLRYNRILCIIIVHLMIFGCITELRAQAQYVTPDSTGNITFTPGLRIQTRYTYDEVDKNNDFFIRRLRLKGKGKVFDLGKYYFEVKIDNSGQFNRQPRAQVENAWLNFPVISDLDVRVGLFDMVFSRNALTSDSKLLLMDRSLIKNALTVLGVTDNTVGILVHGRPLGGHLSYGFGIFDNLGFEVAASEGVLAREADGAMTTGRIVVDLLDPAPAGGYGDYKGSYIGQGRRLSIGTNAAYLSKARIGDYVFKLFAIGADLFFNTGPFTFEAEFDDYEETVESEEGTEVDGNGWYVQGGLMILPRFELTARYQFLNPDDNDKTDNIEWTSAGINIYIRGHSLKLQAEYIFKKEQTMAIANNLFQVQLQFDY